MTKEDDSQSTATVLLLIISVKQACSSISEQKEMLQPSLTCHWVNCGFVAAFDGERWKMKERQRMTGRELVASFLPWKKYQRLSYQVSWTVDLRGRPKLHCSV